VWRQQLDTLLRHSVVQVAAVVGAVSDDPLELLALRLRYFCEGGFRELALREVGSRKVHSERNTRAVDQYHALCPLTFACFSDAEAPFFAGAKVPSMKASLQSSCPASSS